MTSSGNGGTSTINVAIIIGGLVVVAMIVGVSAAVITGRPISDLTTFFGLLVVQVLGFASLHVKQAKTANSVEEVHREVSGDR